KRLASSIIIPHFNAFFQQLNPVQAAEQGSQQNISKINGHFLFSFINFAIISIYGNLALEYESTGTIDWRNLPQSPYILMHQTFLPPVWPLTDPCILASIPVDCLLFLYFAFNSAVDENLKLYPVNNGKNLLIDSKVLDRDVSGKILKFSRNTKK